MALRFQRHCLGQFFLQSLRARHVSTAGGLWVRAQLPKHVFYVLVSIRGVRRNDLWCDGA